MSFVGCRRPSNLIATLPHGSDSINGVNMDHVSILQVNGLLGCAVYCGLSLVAISGVPRIVGIVAQ